MKILKNLRKTKGETQKMLADVIGVSLRSIQHYEAGEVTIPNDKLKAIADHYDVSVSELFKENTIEEEFKPSKEIEELARKCLENWDDLEKHPFFKTKIENLVIKRINQELEARLIEAKNKKSD